MTTDTREPNAPESYATFWAPVPADARPAPAPTNDAYQEFVNVTEDAPILLRVERV